MNAKSLSSPLAAKIWAALFTVAASYMGYEKAQEYKSSGVQVDVKVESKDNGPVHAHGPVVGRDAIKALIKEAIDAQNEKNFGIYKKLESWETN
jgi:hypothetical protein